MTVDAAFVEALAGYVQDDDFTAAQFALYLAWAEDDVATDAPALAGTARDQAVALRVAHYVALRDSRGGEYSTEKSGDWQGTRATAAGETSWSAAYAAHLERELAKVGDAVQPSCGVERADANGSRAFALSDQPLPRMGSNGGLL